MEDGVFQNVTTLPPQQLGSPRKRKEFPGFGSRNQGLGLLTCWGSAQERSEAQGRREESPISLRLRVGPDSWVKSWIPKGWGGVGAMLRCSLETKVHLYPDPWWLDWGILSQDLHVPLGTPAGAFHPHIRNWILSITPDASQGLALQNVLGNDCLIKVRQMRAAFSSHNVSFHARGSRGGKVILEMNQNIVK